MGDIVEFKSRKQLDALVRTGTVNIIEQAAADIDRIVGMGCFHERTVIVGYQPMRRVTCRDCGKQLGEAIHD